MIEIHPFLCFVPKKARYLLLGSFPGKNSGNWFYGSNRNQFWSILESVYNIELPDKESKQKLFENLNMAISDVIYSAERKNGNNLDNNLINITYNNEIVERILEENAIEKIYFTSRFVEGIFRKKFKDLTQKYPEVELITLPSPSPRYALMSKLEKMGRYKVLLSRLAQGVTFILIKSSHKILMQLRDDGNGKKIRYPNVLCFPGGGKENNETYLETVVRECEEEYGLKINPKDFKLLCRYDHDDVYNDNVFTSKVPENVSIILNEGAGFKWMTLQEIEGAKLGFEQKRIIPRLKKYLSSNS